MSQELELLGLIPTGRGAWHGFTITEPRPGVRQGWQITARIDMDHPNPLHRYGVLVRMAGDMGECRARYVPCLADLPRLVATAMADPYYVTGPRA